MALTRHTIVLMGTPNQNEDGAAGEAITPGDLVNGVTTIVRHANASAMAARRFALERSEMGKGIDDDYAVGDTVKVGQFAPGDRVYGFIASGQDLAIGAIVESAGDGTLKAGTTAPIAKALEATGAVTAKTRCRFEII